MKSIRESLTATAEARWESVIPRPGLEPYVRSLWRLVVAVPVVMLFCLVVVVLALVATTSWGLPYMAEVGLGVPITTAAIMSWPYLYWRVKLSAGEALGLSRKDSRRLDISGPEKLQASLERLRRDPG